MYNYMPTNWTQKKIEKIPRNKSLIKTETGRKRKSKYINYSKYTDSVI